MPFPAPFSNPPSTLANPPALPSASTPILTPPSNPAHLLPPAYKRHIALWLEEDCPSFDVGGFVVGEEVREARLLGKSQGMLAGVPFFDEVFRQLDCSVQWHIREGTIFEPITHCATVTGPVHKLLLGERVALNILARSSGIATASSSLLALLRRSGYAGALAGTRKTTPGFRLVEKYAMRIGGCDPHRHDLSAMTMLKDNHIAACGGSVASAVAAARRAGGFALKVEVEVRSEAQAHEAVEAGADVVMLDNFKSEEVEGVVHGLRERWGAERRWLVEVSGGLKEGNLEGWRGDGVDVVSSSSVHQGVPHVDFSLKIVE